MRGAHRTHRERFAGISGPSPRARGSHERVRGEPEEVRSIPACAGLTATGHTCTRVVPVHPRVRGAHRARSGSIVCRFGPSPRARGSLFSEGRFQWQRRSIPACAGLTGGQQSRDGTGQVHPRVRGAHATGGEVIKRVSGPSPRARGSRVWPGVIRRWRTVHPRVRGAHGRGGRRPDPAVGPSPRARGSPSTSIIARSMLRSIPACAGLTRAGPRRNRCRPVHPRVRGAHRPDHGRPRGRCGPSPRARGSQGLEENDDGDVRSIPACAGLTGRALPLPHPGSVHPRVRGAHYQILKADPNATGPSPRARGSQPIGREVMRRWRSIPACAGLTPLIPICHGHATVHPRVRGAHGRLVGAWGRWAGPSPRARGSHHQQHHAAHRDRSIPACAGLTRPRCPAGRARPVHPRVRGAHDDCGPGLHSRPGPSPRARGSRGCAQVSAITGRSIPACAGLTNRHTMDPERARVHPRVRGAHT